MALARFFLILIAISRSVFFACNATCSPLTLSNGYGRVFYSSVTKEKCTWTFVPPPSTPSDILIVDMHFVFSFDSNKDKITFPDDTQPISGDFNVDKGTCRSYRISDDQTRNCTNELTNQYCQQSLVNIINTTLTLKSSHTFRTSSSDTNLFFSFSYAFIDCPSKLDLPSATTIVHSQTLSNYVEKTTKVISGNKTTYGTSLSEQGSNQATLLIPVIALAVILGVSWLLIFILIILFIKRRKNSFTTQINRPAGMTLDKSRNHPPSNNTSNLENHTSSSSGYKINDQPTSVLANDISVREMVDNVLYQESPTLSKATFSKEREVTNNQGIYSMPDGQSTREMVENTLYHAFAGNNS